MPDTAAATDNDLMNLYSRRLLGLAADIPHLGHLDAPEGSAKRRSPQCGSTVAADVVMDGDRVADFAQEVRACALGQASAGLLGRMMPGLTRDEIADGRDLLATMLAGGPVPTGQFADLEVLSAAREFTNRHASIMLAWEAALAAADAALAQKDAPPASGRTAS